MTTRDVRETGVGPRLVAHGCLVEVRKCGSAEVAADDSLRSLGTTDRPPASGPESVTKATF